MFMKETYESPKTEVIDLSENLTSDCTTPIL